MENSGHTDAVGSDFENKKFSHDLAKEVMGYLLRKAIGSSRLAFHGNGESLAVATNDKEERRVLSR